MDEKKEYLDEITQIRDGRNKCEGIGECFDEAEYKLVNSEFIHILYITSVEKEFTELPYLNALYAILITPHDEPYTNLLTAICKCRNNLMSQRMKSKYFHIIKLANEYTTAKNLLICAVLS